MITENVQIAATTYEVDFEYERVPAGANYYVDYDILDIRVKGDSILDLLTRESVRTVIDYLEEKRRFLVAA